MVLLQVTGELEDFVDGAGGRPIELALSGPRSVKDVVESAGVPHPEIALLLVDGASVGFGHRVTGGETIAAHPPSRAGDIAIPSLVAPPIPDPSFVCDVHLGRLTRRLRLLGFDTWYRTDADDDELAAVAVDQARILLTRDRGLLMRRVVVHGYCPRSDDADVQAAEVVRRFGLVHAISPLTRCARCNGLVHAVDKREVVDRLPQRTRAEHDRFARCVSCGQVYWPGSHTRSIEGFVSAVRAAGAQGGHDAGAAC